MDQKELEIKKFELEQKVKLTELDLKKKELELKIQEQKSKTYFTPLLISVIGAILSILTGITLKFFEARATTQLEDRKFQSTLLLKAIEAKNYDEFSAMLLVFQRNGLLSLDSNKIYDFRKQRFVANKLEVDKNIVKEEKSVLLSKDKPLWVTVVGTNPRLADARAVLQRTKSTGFKNIGILKKGESFMTFVGKYETYETAVSELFDVREKLNKSSYVARFDAWCANYDYDSTLQLYNCK